MRLKFYRRYEIFWLASHLHMYPININESLIHKGPSQANASVNGLTIEPYTKKVQSN